MLTQSSPGPVAPWWRHGMVWLVVSGPLLVIVAGVATLWIAVANPDPVLQLRAPAQAAQQPAVQARNHAATPRRSGDAKTP
ncbi:MAG TPA: nitrogen fixation protein FixH [Gammaproteobacteria bacterium]